MFVAYDAISSFIYISLVRIIVQVAFILVQDTRETIRPFFSKPKRRKPDVSNEQVCHLYRKYLTEHVYVITMITSKYISL